MDNIVDEVVEELALGLDRLRDADNVAGGEKERAPSVQGA